MADKEKNPQITHEVYFFNDAQTVGPVLVHTGVEEKDEDEDGVSDDLLAAAAVAQEAVSTEWQIKVRRLNDGEEKIITPREASDWWA